MAVSEDFNEPIEHHHGLGDGKLFGIEIKDFGEGVEGKFGRRRNLVDNNVVTIEKKQS